MQGWLQECLDHHTVCKPSRREPPSRLIDISALKVDQSVKLISGAVSDRYIALSHCWGGENEHKTKKSNIEQRYHAIALEEFGQTFLDAFKIAHLLSIQCLWIDCFCIVQDDPEDCETEIPRMADIFEGATLVVAALEAEDSTTGFLKDRIPSQHHNVRVPNGVTVPVYSHPRINHTKGWDSFPNDFKKPPLVSRAWFFQERILGVRVLYFGEREIEFHCREAMRCECSPAVRDDHVLLDGPEKLARLSATEHNFLPKDFGRMWIYTIKDYTALELTFPEDRLSALAGISKLAQSMNPGRYIAGIWERDIHCQLLWILISPRRSRVDFVSMPASEKPCRRLQKCSTSFSWAAWAEPVMYPAFHAEWESVCEIVDIQSFVRGRNKYGYPDNAYLEVRGKLVPFESLYNALEPAGQSERSKQRKPNRLDGPKTLAFLDYHVQGNWSQFVVLVLVKYSGGKGKPDMFDGLVLRKGDAHHFYTRAGVVSHLSPIWLEEDLPLQTIRIY